MGTVRVACPHCDYSRDVPQEKLPAKRVRVTCPKCGKPFVFEADNKADAPQQPPHTPMQVPPGQPVSSAAPKPEEGVQHAGSVHVACPNCDYSRDVPQEKLPAKRVRVTCPKCRKPFVFEAGEKADEPQQPPPPINEAPEQPVSSAAPEQPEPPALPEPPVSTKPIAPPVWREPPADDNAVINVRCPGCGFAKDVPEGRVPVGSTRISCPRCRQGFTFKRPAPPLPPATADIPKAGPQEHEGPDKVTGEPQDVSAPAGTAQTPSFGTAEEEDAREQDSPYGRVAGHAGIGALLADAWYSFRKKAFTLYGLLLLTYLLPVLSAAAIGAGTFLLAGTMPDWQAYIFAAGTLIGGLAFTGLAGMTFGGLIHAVSDERLGIIDALGAGRLSAWSFVWVWLLLFFMVAGGTLFFVVPGIVFAVWFAFSFFVLVAEGETGMAALIRSGYYVRGRWIGVFGRLLIVWLVSLAGAAPFVGPFISFILSPIILVYMHKLYLYLAASRPADEHSPGLGERLKWAMAGVSGFALAAVLVIVYAPSLTAVHGVSYDRLEKHLGLGRLTKISLPQIRHKGPGGELEAAYREYREALENGDMAALKETVTPEAAGRLGGTGGRNMADMLQAAAPVNVKATTYNMEGDEATLFVEGESGGGVVMGEISFVRQSDSWKVAKESWETAPRPESSVLGGDVPAFDPIEQELLSAAVVGTSETYRFFDPEDAPRRLLALTGHEEAVSGLAFGPDSARLLSSSYNGSAIRLWEVESGEQLDYLKLDARPVSTALTPDGTLLLVTDDAGNVSLISVGPDRFASGQVVEASLGRECRVAVSPNGKLFATASQDRIVTIWDIGSTKELRRIETAGPMSAIAFSPSGRILAAGGKGGKLTLWDLAAGSGGTYTASVAGEHADISAIAVSPDSSRLVTGQTDGSITVWDAGTQEELLRRRVSNASITGAGFSPDGSVFVTAHSDGEISLWDSATADKLSTLSGRDGGPSALAFSPDGRFLASCGADKSVVIWRGAEALAAPAPVLDDAIPVTVSMNRAGAQSTGAAVWLEKTSFSPGESIKAHFTAPDGYEPDAWIGIVPSDKPHGSEAENDKYDIAFIYLAGRTSGIIKFDAPPRPGKYDLRMHDAETGGREVSYTSFTVSSDDGSAPTK